MALAQEEARAQRAITKAFIGANPSSLVLIPREMQRHGTGTSYVDQPPRAAQTFRLIDQSSTRGPQPGTVRAADGSQRLVEFQLLGEHDASIGLYDYWLDSVGVRLEVADILPDNGYERRALVVRYGETPTGGA